MQTFVETGEPALDPHSQALVRARAWRASELRKAATSVYSHSRPTPGTVARRSQFCRETPFVPAIRTKYSALTWKRIGRPKRRRLQTRLSTLFLLAQGRSVRHDNDIQGVDGSLSLLAPEFTRHSVSPLATLEELRIWDDDMAGEHLRAPQTRTRVM